MSKARQLSDSTGTKNDDCMIIPTQANKVGQSYQCHDEFDPARFRNSMAKDIVQLTVTIHLHVKQAEAPYTVN
jgi:hypothetical protein